MATSKPWVVNASPLIILGKIGRLDLLHSIAPSLVVPRNWNPRDHPACPQIGACSRRSSTGGSRLGGWLTTEPQLGGGGLKASR